MRDIYPRKLSEKSLSVDGIGGFDGEQLRTDATATCNATSQRRTSMSNSMTFVGGNSMSSSISSLFSNNETDSEAPGRRRTGEDYAGSTSSLPLPIRLNRTLTNVLNSMFQCKSEEAGLSPSTHSVKISTKPKMSTSLMDRTYSEESGQEDAGNNINYPINVKREEGFDRPIQLMIPGNARLDTSNHANRCPLCLDNMSSADLAHPPQCSTSACTFNFCLDCAESYIASSKDPYQKASDGSQQLKVFLRCPSCRSDLSTTLRDTVLLRHSEIVATSSDEIKLTPSDLSLKDAMSSDSYIQTAVAIAKKREETFFRDGTMDQGLGAEIDSNMPCHGIGTNQKRRHSFFYGLIEEAKEAREKKKALETQRHRAHNRCHSVV